MKNRMLKIIIVAISVVVLAVANVAPTFAASSGSSGDVCGSSNVPDSVRDAAGCSSGNSNALPIIIQNILNSVIFISGTIAVVFIVIGGISYMTSTGDPGKVKKAKDTILYAVLGLVICVLAFAITNWTISAIQNAGNGTSSSSSNNNNNSSNSDSDRTNEEEEDNEENNEKDNEEEEEDS